MSQARTLLLTLTALTAFAGNSLLCRAALARAKLDQTTMIGFGLWKGECFRPSQIAGFCLACTGLVALLLPGLAAPPLGGALLMLGAGIAWGAYSLRGKGAGDPLRVSAGNFLRAAPMALLMSALWVPRASLNLEGALYAVLSGALASGLGYAIWYSALPSLKAMTAASVQLSVPVFAAFGGALFLNETLTLRLVLASAAILGGIALVVVQKRTA